MRGLPLNGVAMKGLTKKNLSTTTVEKIVNQEIIKIGRIAFWSSFGGSRNFEVKKTLLITNTFEEGA